MTTAERSPLRGSYLVRNPAWNAWLRAADFGLRLVAPSSPSQPVTPRRILVAIGGHLGDAIIATSVFPLLRRAWPDAAIGVVLGSWAARAVEGHPDVRWIHTVDHWKLARSDSTLRQKVVRWRATREVAVQQMREIDYDVAIDLSAYYPNMAGVLYGASIPNRLGWISGGYGPLYTTAAHWNGGASHTAEQHLQLVRLLSPEVIDRASLGEPLAYDLPPIPPPSVARARALVEFRDFVVVHMGAGNSRKEWGEGVERWRAVAKALISDGVRVVLTGAGEAERNRARMLVSELPDVIDLTDVLGWNVFRAVIASARAVITVDTAAAHVAAAHDVPTVVIGTGMNDARHWRPLGRHVTTLMEPVPCAPCFLSRGCESMSCVRGVTEQAVLQATRAWLTACRWQGGGA